VSPDGPRVDSQKTGATVGALPRGSQRCWRGGWAPKDSPPVHFTLKGAKRRARNPATGARKGRSVARTSIDTVNASRFRPGFLASFGHAWDGLVHTVVHQRNMRMHVVAAVLVGLVGSGIPLGLAEKVILIFCVLFVFFAEILNSALEALVDLATEQLHEKARITKDAAAAGVLVLALGTVVVFAALLVHHWEVILTHQALIRRQVALGVPLALCTALLVLPGRWPALLDTLVFLVGSALVGFQSLKTTSTVFTALTFGLLVLAYAAAREHRPGWGAKKRPGTGPGPTAT
jgi:diacylglycerol kinase (ATP)